MAPLVSCILVTRDRPAFFAQALRCYAAQTYAETELVVVDDGEASMEAVCAQVAGLKNLTYIRLPERTPTGSKLNVGITAARGDILQKIDDDDYYGPAFLATAVAHLDGAPAVETLVAWCCFVVLIAGEPDLYFSGHGWQAGGSFCFRRALWQRQPFRDMYASSDSWFIRDNQPRIVRACAADQYLVVRHGANTWRRITGAESVEGYFRQRRFPKTINELVPAADVPFYQSLMDGHAPAPWMDPA